MKIFTALKKEVVALGVWLDRGLEMALSLNTLHQCTRRIELRSPTEKVLPEEENVKIVKSTIPTFEHKFNGDKVRKHVYHNISIRAHVEFYCGR